MARVSAVARVALARRVAIPVRRTALICHHMNRPESAQKTWTAQWHRRRRPKTSATCRVGMDSRPVKLQFLEEAKGRFVGRRVGRLCP